MHLEVEDDFLKDLQIEGFDNLFIKQENVIVILAELVFQYLYAKSLKLIL